MSSRLVVLTFISLFVAQLIGCSTLSERIPIRAVEKKSKAFSVRWSKNLDPVYNTGNLPISLNGAIINDGIVYLGSGRGVMHALNLSDGRVIWQQQERGAFHASPAIYENSVIYGTVSGRVISRNRLTGKLIYEIALGSSVESTGVIDSGVIFFLLRNHQLVSLDVKTGKLLWSYKRAVPFMTTLQGVANPVVIQDRIYIGFADSYLVCFSKVDGNLLWEKKLAVGHKFIDVDITPTIFRNSLVTASAGGPLNFIDPKSGVTRNILNVFVAASPLYLAQGMLAGTVDGEVVLIDKNLKVLLRKKVSNGAISSLSFWQGSVLVGTTDGYLIELDQNSFAVKSSKFLGSYASAIFSAPVIWKGYLGVTSSRNRFYLFH